MSHGLRDLFFIEDKSKIIKVEYPLLTRVPYLLLLIVFGRKGEGLYISTHFIIANGMIVN